MADCTSCGVSLGWKRRLFGGGETRCADCVRSESEATERLSEEYRTALLAVVDGAATSATIARMKEIQSSGQLSSSRVSLWNAEAFKLYTNRLLADDILSADEEEEWDTTSDVLGVDNAALQTTFREQLFRLIIARANAGRMPVMNGSTLLTKKGELVHIEFPAALMKEVTVREFRGASSGFSFPIVKGVRYRVGGVRGRSVVVGTELQVSDEGMLAVTSTRTVFMGSRKTLEMPHTKLLSMTVFTDGLRLHLSNRQNAPLFQLENGDVVGAVINGALQVGTAPPGE